MRCICGKYYALTTYTHTPASGGCFFLRWRGEGGLLTYALANWSGENISQGANVEK